MDVKEIAPQTLDALFSRVEKAPTPEKVAENDYLMKCQSTRRLLALMLTNILQAR